MSAAAGDLSPRVLLVDDRPDNLLALRAVLDPLDYELVEAASGEEALRQLLTEEFALIILDVQMPGMDGFETANLIRRRERTRYVPIIFLTAISGEPEHYLRGYESGAVDYVYKPFEPEILRAKVTVFAELWSRGATIERQREQLAGQAVELERSNAALERFAQVVSHEVRGPLHTVAGLLDLLADRSRGDLTGDGALLVDRAAAGVNRARERVGELLEYARVVTGEMAAEEVSLAEALAEAETGLRGRLEAVGAKVSIDDLPTVQGDRDQLVRLFAHLLERALRTQGDDPLSVRVWSVARDGAWRVAVADNGPGLSPADLPRLFTVWGSELGPALCRRIVERHSGTIWAEAPPDGGTRVWFEIPRQ